jgi:hypothetical protein
VKKLKKKPFRLTFGHLIRLGLFIFVIYSLINYFSQNQANYKTQSEVLGETVPTSDIINKYSTDIYQKLPPDTQQKITELPELPIILEIKKQLNGFPLKQINQFKIEIIKKISQDMINNLTPSSPTPQK